MTQPTFASVAVLIDRLGELHGRTRETPLFNPVFQLGLDISRALEAGELTLDGIAALVAELGCLSLQSRAARLRGLVRPLAADEDCPAPCDRLGIGLDTGDFDGFRREWENPQMHAVFTGHPQLLLTRSEKRR